MQGINKICMLTTAHSPFDVRIFHKEAKSLVQAGYDVTLIAQHDKREIIEGVKIINLQKPSNRIVRMTRTVWSAFRKALKVDADVYHFHDPELIPIALLLRLMRKKVIYDIHEDYRTSVNQKKYLPVFVRRILSVLIGWFEVISSKFFFLILAEKYYSERFHSGVQILNYPDLKLERMTENIEDVRGNNLIYTGGINVNRGAYIHANLVNLLPDIDVWLVGICDKKLADELYDIAGVNSNRLHIDGNSYVPHEIISAYYISKTWIAGLAVFPPTEHYVRKELTKFFEYMAAGIPIIASNFPVWKQLIEGSECGICVNPLDPASTVDAIRWLIDHPTEAKAMGVNGQKAISERYNWDMESKKLIKFYEDVLK